MTDREWEIPARWGLTDGRIIFSLSTLQLPEETVKQIIPRMTALITEACRCYTITRLQKARENLLMAGADSNWLEVIEDMILKEMRGK